MIEMYLVGTAAVVSGLALFQWIVLPVGNFVGLVVSWAKAQTK